MNLSVDTACCQRVLEIRIHSASGLRSSGEAFVEIELATGAEKPTVIKTGQVPVLGHNCVIGSWTRIPTNAAAVVLKVRQTAGWWQGLGSAGPMPVYATATLPLTTADLEAAGAGFRFLELELTVQDHNPHLQHQSHKASGARHPADSAAVKAAANAVSDNVTTKPAAAKKDVERPLPCRSVPDSSDTAEGAPCKVHSDLVTGITAAQARSSAKLDPDAAASTNSTEATVDPEMNSAPVRPAGGQKGRRGPRQPAQQPTLNLEYRITEICGKPSLAAEVPIMELPRVAHTYAHGGFMGLAISMMSDPQWRTFLQEEDPPTYGRAAPHWEAGTRPQKNLPGGLPIKDTRNKRLIMLMTVLENSPVLCAYGLNRYGLAVPVRQHQHKQSKHRLEVPERLADKVAISQTADTSSHADALPEAEVLGSSFNPSRVSITPYNLSKLAADKWLGAARTRLKLSLEQGVSRGGISQGTDLERQQAIALTIQPLTAQLDNASMQSDAPSSPEATQQTSGDLASASIQSATLKGPPQLAAHTALEPPAPAAPGAGIEMVLQSGSPPNLASTAAEAGPPSTAAAEADRGSQPAVPPVAESMGRDSPADAAEQNSGAPYDAGLVSTSQPVAMEAPAQRRGAQAGGRKTAWDAVLKPGMWRTDSMTAHGSPASGQLRTASMSATRSDRSRAFLNWRNRGQAGEVEPTVESSSEDEGEGEGPPDDQGPQNGQGQDNDGGDVHKAVRAFSGTGSHSLQVKSSGELLDGIAGVNAYGYAPLSLEWDLWVSPTQPGNMREATVDHGSQSALVKQAILSALPCMGSCARSAGARQILTQGIRPTRWMTTFGRSLNRARSGDAAVPLPLQGPVAFNYRLHVRVLGGRGGAFADAADWDHLYIRLQVEQAKVQVARRVTKRQRPHNGVRWDQDCTFWPIPPSCTDALLVLNIRGDPAGISWDRGVGVIKVPLSHLLQGKEVPTAAKPLAGWWEVGRNVKLGRKGRYSAGNFEGPKVPQVRSIEGADGVLCHYWQATTQPVQQAAADREPAMVELSMWLEPVSVIDAAVEIGVERAAAQSCLAMCAAPGGIFLDIKSAYSSAADIELFCGAMTGLGIHCKAICSFSPRQLQVGERVPTVLFFHGLSGLENACDSGLVRKGTCVLFNGASFLEDLSPEGVKALGTATFEALIDDRADEVLNPLAWRKYCACVSLFGFYGGIYIQEPDASAASIDALVRLVAQNPVYFPLGFAYGHLPGHAVSFADQMGRGFAAQQLLEELAARKELSKKVADRIRKGEHRKATFTTNVSWASRLLYGGRVMDLWEQRLFLRLLAQLWPQRMLPPLIKELGGMQRLVMRFWEHYEMTTPLTLLEQGYNFNHSKSALRLLRNRAVLSSLSASEKVALAAFFCSSDLYGYGLTWVLMYYRLRYGLHKVAKEGLVCLLESCTKDEFGKVVASLGGLARVARLLRGHLRLSFAYWQRLLDVEGLHAKDPTALAYQCPELKYAAVNLKHEVEGWELEEEGYMHSRDKSRAMRCWKAARKCGCCACTTVTHLLAAALTACLWPFFCCCPRVAGPYFKGCCGLSACAVWAIFFVLCALLFCLILTFTTVGITIET